MTGTQAALYADIDLELSWSESELPQSERTKHVHGLHPYLGKFPPQLAEALISNHCTEGGLVLDPFFVALLRQPPCAPRLLVRETERVEH